MGLVEIEKDFASPAKKLKLDKDLGEEHNAPVPMSQGKVLTSPKSCVSKRLQIIISCFLLCLIVVDIVDRIANDDLGGGKPEKEVILSEDEARQQYKRWCTGIHLSNSNPDKDYRFRVFKENLERCIRKNREFERLGKSQRVGLNCFSDMTDDEFLAMYRWSMESDTDIEVEVDHTDDYDNIYSDDEMG